MLIATMFGLGVAVGVTLFVVGIDWLCAPGPKWKRRAGAVMLFLVVWGLFTAAYWASV